MTKEPDTRAPRGPLPGPLPGLKALLGLGLSLGLYLCMGLVGLALSGPAPAFAAVFRFNEAASGVPVWVEPEVRLPLVTVSLFFAGTREFEPPGLSVFAAQFLGEGTSRHAPSAFKELLEAQNIQLSVRSTPDGLLVQFRTLREHFAAAQALVIEALVEPRLTAANLTRLKALQRNQWTRTLASDEARVFEAWLTLLSPASSHQGHQSYLAQTQAALEALDGLSVASIRDLYARQLTSARLHVSIIGTVSREEAAVFTQALAEALPRGAPFEPPAQALALTPWEELPRRVEVAGRPLTHLLFGARLVPPEHPDYLALRLAVRIFGGGLTSRLGQTLRETYGFTYNASASYLVNRRLPLVVGGLAVRPEDAAEAYQHLRQIWQTYVDQGPTAAELERAKARETGAYLLALSGSRALGAYLVRLNYLGFEPSYVHERAQLVQAVGQKDVQAALRTYFPSQLASPLLWGPGVSGAAP